MKPRILQSHLVGGTAEAHVDWLLECLAPREGAVIVDMGSGFGEVARLMSLRRPDLQFILVNVSKDEMLQAPRGPQFQWEFTPAEKTALPSGAADIVMFGYSLGFTNRAVALHEAWRVMKPSGVLALYEPTGADEAFMEVFNYRVNDPKAEIPGFSLMAAFSPEGAVPDEAREWLYAEEEGEIYERTFGQCVPYLSIYCKEMVTPGTPEEVFGRHEKVALSFSGGKDSMACLYYLREYWDRLTVYWLNTGDPLPETVEIMELVRQMVPNFVEIRTDVGAWRKVNGMPSDLVPTNSQFLGRVLGFGSVKVADRFQCCQENIMVPLFQRMVDDGNTCIIRGQKACDMPSIPHFSGEVIDGVEIYYPIEQWSHSQVMEYLDNVGAILHPCYEDGNTIGVDCAHCTGWWHESHFDYLKAKHPVIWMEVQGDLNKLRGAIDAHWQHFPKE